MVKNRIKSDKFLVTFPQINVQELSYIDVYNATLPMCKQLSVCQEAHETHGEHIHAYIVLKEKLTWADMLDFFETRFNSRCGGKIDVKKVGNKKPEQVHNYVSGLCLKKGMKLNPRLKTFVEVKPSHQQVMSDWFEEVFQRELN